MSGSDTTKTKKRILTTKPILPAVGPAISTARLLLRPLVVDDIQAFHQLRSGPEGMRFSSQGFPDPDVAPTKTKLDPLIPPQNRVGGKEAYIFAVEEHSNLGVLLGHLGMITRDGITEIGYSLRKAFWGRGYATEAVRAFLDHYWGQLEREEVVYEVDQDEGIYGNEKGMGVVEHDGNQMERRKEVLTAMVETTNAASIRILEKSGFVKVRTFVEDSRGVELAVFDLERPG